MNKSIRSQFYQITSIDDLCHAEQTLTDDLCHAEQTLTEDLCHAE